MLKIIMSELLYNKIRFIISVVLYSVFIFTFYITLFLYTEINGQYNLDGKEDKTYSLFSVPTIDGGLTPVSGTWLELIKNVVGVKHYARWVYKEAFKIRDSNNREFEVNAVFYHGDIANFIDGYKPENKLNFLCDNDKASCQQKGVVISDSLKNKLFSGGNDRDFLNISDETVNILGVSENDSMALYGESFDLLIDISYLEKVYKGQFNNIELFYSFVKGNVSFKDFEYENKHSWLGVIFETDSDLTTANTSLLSSTKTFNPSPSLNFELTPSGTHKSEQPKFVNTHYKNVKKGQFIDSMKFMLLISVCMLICIVIAYGVFNAYRSLNNRAAIQQIKAALGASKKALLIDELLYVNFVGILALFVSMLITLSLYNFSHQFLSHFLFGLDLSLSNLGIVILTTFIVVLVSSSVMSFAKHFCLDEKPKNISKYSRRKYITSRAIAMLQACLLLLVIALLVLNYTGYSRLLSESKSSIDNEIGILKIGFNNNPLGMLNWKSNWLNAIKTYPELVSAVAALPGGSGVGVVQLSTEAGRCQAAMATKKIEYQGRLLDILAINTDLNEVKNIDNTIKNQIIVTKSIIDRCGWTVNQALGKSVLLDGQEFRILSVIDKVKLSLSNLGYEPIIFYNKKIEAPYNLIFHDSNEGKQLQKTLTSKAIKNGYSIVFNGDFGDFIDIQLLEQVQLNYTTIFILSIITCFLFYSFALTATDSWHERRLEWRIKSALGADKLDLTRELLQEKTIEFLLSALLVLTILRFIFNNLQSAIPGVTSADFDLVIIILIVTFSLVIIFSFIYSYFILHKSERD